MKSNYKRLGPYIREIDVRNTKGKEENLLGVSTNKTFIPSIANTVGTDFKKYKIVEYLQFTYVPDTSRRGDRIGIALLEEYCDALVSSAYTVFEITNHNELLPEYLMMWFRRAEFDRYARYMSHGSVREMFDWEEMCNVELPIPDSEKQKEIVQEYNVIVNRIGLNEELNTKLEETARAIYKQWFVNFKFPDNGKRSLIESGFDEFKLIPMGWCVVRLDDITSKIGSGSTPKGGKTTYKNTGIPLVRSLNVFDFNFVYKDLAFIDASQAEKLDNAQLNENDVLINITGVSVTRCCIVSKSIVPARVNQHVAVVRPVQDSYLAYYILCALCSTNYKSRLLGVSEGGSTRQALTKENLEECLLLLPDINTRMQFDNLMSLLFKSKNKFALENQLLTNIIELLLSKMAIK